MSPEPSLPQAEQPQLSQPFLTGEVLQPSDHFGCPPLDLLQQVDVFPGLRAPELDAGLQVRSVQSRTAGQNHLPRPNGRASFYTAQDMAGLLGCERTLLAYVQLFIHQYPQVVLGRTPLNPFIPQLILILGVASTEMQDLALGLVQPHEVHTGPFLELVHVSKWHPIPQAYDLHHSAWCHLFKGEVPPNRWPLFKVAIIQCIYYLGPRLRFCSSQWKCL